MQNDGIMDCGGIKEVLRGGSAQTRENAKCDGIFANSPMMEKCPDILTVKQVADVLQIGRNAAYRLINGKEIRSIRIGKNIRVPKICVEEYLRNTIMSCSGQSDCLYNGGTP